MLNPVKYLKNENKQTEKKEILENNNSNNLNYSISPINDNNNISNLNIYNQNLVYTESMGKLVDLIEKVHKGIKSDNSSKKESDLITKKKNKDDEMIINFKQLMQNYTKSDPHVCSVFDGKYFFLSK